MKIPLKRRQRALKADEGPLEEDHVCRRCLEDTNPEYIKEGSSRIGIRRRTTSILQKSKIPGRPLKCPNCDSRYRYDAATGELTEVVPLLERVFRFLRTLPSRQSTRSP